MAIDPKQPAPDAAEQARLHMLDKIVSVAYADGMSYECEVVDAKWAYGHLRLKVRPVAGTAHVWIDAERATILPGRQKSEKATDEPETSQ